jgi:hypothetical protein
MIALTVTLILNVPTMAEACDAANEILREQQRDFAPGSCLLDYDVSGTGVVIAGSNQHYSEGDAFVA